MTPDSARDAAPSTPTARAAPGLRASEILVRPLASSDSLVELAALVHRAYIRLGNQDLRYVVVEPTAAALAERLPGGTCFVAEEDGVLVGTVLVHPADAATPGAGRAPEGVGCVSRFAVDPRMQGRGVGQRLMAHLEQWARETGWRELVIDTSREAGHLVAFHRRRGYFEIGEMPPDGQPIRSVMLSKMLDGELL